MGTTTQHFWKYYVALVEKTVYNDNCIKKRCELRMMINIYSRFSVYYSKKIILNSGNHVEREGYDPEVVKTGGVSLTNAATTVMMKYNQLCYSNLYGVLY